MSCVKYASIGVFSDPCIPVFYLIWYNGDTVIVCWNNIIVKLFYTALSIFLSLSGCSYGNSFPVAFSLNREKDIIAARWKISREANI